VISLECHRARALVDARAGGLDETARLRLEAHLDECARCAADADAIEAVRAALRPVPVLSEARRARALAGALQLAQAGALAQPRASRTRVAVVSAGVALAAAAAFLVMFPRSALAPHALAPTQVTASSPAATQVEAPPPKAPAPAVQALRDGIEQSFETSERVQAGHALLRVAADTRLRWQAENATLHLLAGQVEAQVDPAPQRRFLVATEHFVVEVTGTRFTTTLQDVRVHEGSVRIETPDGAVLHASLTAGEHWTHEAKASTARAPARKAASWLALARKRLAGRDVEGARAAIASALAGEASRIERAEALTLRAECALAQGRVEEALAGYREVAERYLRLPAGDNALFAAAGLALRQGNAVEARRLYARYLERYPDGRFAPEASSALARIRSAGE
jgi:TolA-binding protein